MIASHAPTLMSRAIGMVAAWILCVLAGHSAAADSYVPRDGDIIFHTSRSRQSLAVTKATSSPHSHMGIVYLRDGKPEVYEAVEPVKYTPLDKWIARGTDNKYIVKRLKDADRLLTTDTISRMKAAGAPYEEKSYDITFEWSDDRIYCSELVYKVYNEAVGVEIGALQTLKEFNLSDPAVQAKIKERWPDQPPPDQPVISPASMFDSPLLETVYPLSPQ